MQGQSRIAMILQSSRLQAPFGMCAKLCLKIPGQSLILGQVTLAAAATSTTVTQLWHWCAAAFCAALVVARYVWSGLQSTVDYVAPASGC